MAIYRMGEHIPNVDDSAWVADSAQVIGRITLAAESSIWFGSVLRGDNEPLVVGRGSNVQENCVMHADEGFPLVLGDGVTIGHQVMLHGCSIGDGSLIGIQSILLNGVRIGKNCLVGAGSLVTEGKTFPDGVLIVGRPATVVRELTAEQIAGLRQSAEAYVAKAHQFRAELVRVA